MFGFVKSFFGVKVDQAVKESIEFLVKLDPKAASEAELRQMEKELDKLGTQLAETRADYATQRREADEVRKLAAQRMAAAEKLQGDIAATTDPTRKSGLERSLTTLVGMLEQLQPDIAREEQEAKDAQEFLQLLETTYQEAGGKLRSARADLEKAQRDMHRAEQQRVSAERQAEAARQAAGLASATSGLSVALRAMQDAATEDRNAAEAARAKAAMLRPTQPEQADPNIAAAMAAVSGATPAPAASVADRLASLKAQLG